MAVMGRSALGAGPPIWPVLACFAASAALFTTARLLDAADRQACSFANLTDDTADHRETANP